MAKETYTILPVRLTPLQYKQVTRFAKKEKVSKAEIIRRLITTNNLIETIYEE